MVSVFYFTPLPGFFSPFPLGTCSLSVTREYLALRNGLRSFRQDSTCPALLRILQEPSVFRLQDFHPLRFNFPVNSTILMVSYSYIEVLQPQIRRFGLGSSPFARHYLGNRFFFLFLRLLRCFSSPGCSLYKLCVHYRMTVFYYCRVPPFGNLWIKAYLLLPKAYRCSSRPSSASSAKASAMRPY